MTVIDGVDIEAEESNVTSPAADELPIRVKIDRLSVGFEIGEGHERRRRDIVENFSLELRAGQCVAIVGESGSGKSVTARTLVGLTGAHAIVSAEELSFEGTDLLAVSERAWRDIRGCRIGFILQDALVSLDPLRPVGREIDEALRLHGWGDRRARRAKVIELLASVGVPSPALRAKQRPDELSGGLRQRALIASAIALDPDVIVADEPTTALDVTVQAQVLDLIEETKNRGTSVILISHDLSVVARLADHIIVMRGGRIVESGDAHQILHQPQHPYTRRLLDAIPSEATRGLRLAGEHSAHILAAVESAESPAALDAVTREESADAPALVATDLVKSFVTPDGARTRAVDGVSFELERGTTLGIVGESGSGKSTTARIALALERADSGTVELLGQPWSVLSEPRRRALRPQIAVVSQDPLSSFDPRWNVERILLDALPAGRRTRTERDTRVRELLDQVGLPHEVLPRFPLRLSGGQRQRVAIARALASAPSVIVLDEAVSALDVSVQAQILDLLVALQKRFALSYLFISHDLGVIAHLSDSVLVMKDGKVVERGTVDEIFNRPEHPYTRELIGSLPSLDDDVLPSSHPVRSS